MNDSSPEKPAAWRVQHQHGGSLYFVEADARRAVENLKQYAHTDAVLTPLYEAPARAPEMKIVIEKGQHQWFARAETLPPPFSGLLVAGPSLDFVLTEISDAFEELEEAATEGPS